MRRRRIARRSPRREDLRPHPTKGVTQCRPITNIFPRSFWFTATSWTAPAGRACTAFCAPTSSTSPIVQNPTLTLSGDVAATKHVVDDKTGPVILVGHSYGGAVITEAGNDPKVAALVYVTAFAPDKGESVQTLIAGAPAGAPVPPILPPRGGLLLLDRAKFAEAFAADLRPEQAAFMADSQVPAGVEALAEAVSSPAWRTKPSFYLVATHDRMIPPPAQRQMAQRAGATVAEAPGSPRASFRVAPGCRGLSDQAGSCRAVAVARRLTASHDGDEAPRGRYPRPSPLPRYERVLGRARRGGTRTPARRAPSAPGRILLRHHHGIPTCLGKSGLPVSRSVLRLVGDVRQSAHARPRHRMHDRGVRRGDELLRQRRGLRAGQIGARDGRGARQAPGWRRDSYILSSKVFWGGVPNPKPTQKGLHRKHVFEACHQALERLQVDYLDLYFCHRPDPQTPIEETVRTMSDLVHQGKVLYWGTSEWSAAQLEEAYRAATAPGLVAPTMEQPQYNMLVRDRVEREYAPLYDKHGLGTTIYGRRSTRAASHGQGTTTASRRPTLADEREAATSGSARPARGRRGPARDRGRAQARARGPRPRHEHGPARAGLVRERIRTSAPSSPAPRAPSRCTTTCRPWRSFRSSRPT